ncbi:C40 family peptidase [Alkalicoccus luteus]|uniref:C40 family peptidase n=1 Tax=Alkalicoccus luteus TaxID=1237094 RepID=UPI00403347D9
MDKRQKQSLILLISGIAAAGVFLYVLFSEPAETPQNENSEDNERSFGELDPDLDRAAAAAEALIGTPFESDGTDPESGLNSSGLIQYVFEEETGIRMPRLAAHQQDLGEAVPLEEAQRGDLVFFEADTLMAGMYTGGEQAVVVSTSDGAVEVDVTEGFWGDHFTEARRLSEHEKEALHPSSYTDHEHPAVRESMQYLDTPYEFGGSTLEAFDCSFFVQEVYREAGDVYLPRVTIDQVQTGQEIQPDETRPGDVLYFSDVDVEDRLREEGEVTHAGIYLGDGFMIHASRTENKTQISRLNDYWEDAYTETRRFDDMAVESDLLRTAADYLNVPFETGGSSPEDGFNTSGFVRHVFDEARDLSLPDRAASMWETGSEVSRDALEPEDVIFFEGSSSLLPGIYIGNDLFFIASESSGVTIRHLEYSDFFADRFEGARRMQ